MHSTAPFFWPLPSKAAEYLRDQQKGFISGKERAGFCFGFDQFTRLRIAQVPISRFPTKGPKFLPSVLKASSSVEVEFGKLETTKT